MTTGKPEDGEPVHLGSSARHSETLATPASPAAMTPERTWWPIDSAPKDGTPVRLRWEGTTVEANGRWCPAHEWPKPFASDDWRDVVGNDVLLMPTHWTPIVPSPARVEAPEGAQVVDYSLEEVARQMHDTDNIINEADLRAEVTRLTEALAQRTDERDAVIRDALKFKAERDAHAGALEQANLNPGRSAPYGPEPVFTPPNDATDDAIFRAATNTASRLGLFAATWPEFFAFGKACRDQQAEALARLEQQSRDISVVLSDAGCPAMPIPEGARWLLAERQRWYDNAVEERVKRVAAEKQAGALAFHKAQHEKWVAVAERQGAELADLTDKHAEQAGALTTLREALEEAIYALTNILTEPQLDAKFPRMWTARERISNWKAALAASAPEKGKTDEKG